MVTKNAQSIRIINRPTRGMRKRDQLSQFIFHRYFINKYSVFTIHNSCINYAQICFVKSFFVK